MVNKCYNHITYISKLEYFLIFLFCVLCGFTAGNIIPAKTYILVLLGLWHRSQFPSKYKGQYSPLIILILGYLGIYLIHNLLFHYNDTVLLDKIILIIGGYFVLRRLGARFPFGYFKVMYWISLISLICYFLFLLGITLNIDFINREGYQGIFFWNIRDNEILLKRNCGPYWEPGAYAGMLLMIPFMYFNNWRWLWSKYRFKCLVLILSFITTFSTQGYVCATILVGIYYIQDISRRNIIRIAISCLSLVLIAGILFVTLPFLREKIMEQFLLSLEWNTVESLNTANRFTTTMLDLANISKSPIWGNTSNSDSLYGEYSHVMSMIESKGSYGSGSGMTSYMACYGIGLYLLWQILAYLSLKKYYNGKWLTFCMCIFLFLLGQCEQYLAYIYYLCVPFLFFCKKKSLCS